MPILPMVRPKNGGAYQCVKCGKSVDTNALLELKVRCGRSRLTTVWCCVEHLLGDEALMAPAIADNMRSSDMHKEIDKRRIAMNRDRLLASRFTTSTEKTDNIHDFVPVNSPVAKKMESDPSTFVAASTLKAKLGIPPDAILSLVESLGISIVNHGSVPSIKMDDFLLISQEVRRRSAESRRIAKQNEEAEGLEGSSVEL